MRNLDGPRGRTVLKALPNLESYRTVLYVGANPWRFHLYGKLCRKELYVLEIFPPYVDELRKSKRRKVAGIIQGDIRDIENNAEINRLAPFDLLVWWHGPEHVRKSQLWRLLGPDGIIHRYYSKAILLGCPWGYRLQEPVRGNIHEAHVSHLYLSFFQALGYNTLTVGKKDRFGHITAWKTKGEVQ